jgi:hypothetical protein
MGGAKLQEAAPKRADLRNSFPWEADFENAALQGADLRGAEFEDTNLKDADLRGARLQATVLSTCDLECVYVSGAWLQRTQLQYQQRRNDRTVKSVCQFKVVLRLSPASLKDKHTHWVVCYQRKGRLDMQSLHSVGQKIGD